MSKLIRIETEKTPKEVIEDIKKKAFNFNFIIRDVFDMAQEFRHHGVEIPERFEYYSLMLCNPQKAYKSISASPVRGAILLPPKQVVVYKENGRTILAYVAIEQSDVKALLPDDYQFQKGLEGSCRKIVNLMRSIN